MIKKLLFFLGLRGNELNIKIYKLRDDEDFVFFGAEFH